MTARGAISLRMWRYYNPNPAGKHTGDCVIRAVCKATGKNWDTVLAELYVWSHALKEMPDLNSLWSEYLHSLGFTRHALPDSCPYCYTVRDFCRDHPRGAYILATGTHLVTVVNGDWYDTTDTGFEIPIYYWR